ncbi:MAG: hypothetical protein K2M17_04305 [Bacilli bacterium]|nr:hypothetical protein [Bacilli bacterium]
MRLGVNKSHKSGRFAKKTNGWTKVFAAALSVSLFSGFLTLAYRGLEDIGEVVEVTEDVRDSIYKEFPSRYPINASSSLKDRFITDGTLSKVEKMYVDLSKTVDLSFLSYCNNLQSLYITHAEMLTPDILLELSSYTDIAIILQFDCEAIQKQNSPSLDLSILKDLNVCLTSNSSLEVKNYILYKFLRGIDESWVAFGNCDLFKAIDKKLDSLLQQIDFSGVTCQEDIIYKLLFFMDDYISYDEKISSVREEDYGQEEKSLIHEYNAHDLSFILGNNEKTVLGICCNYSSLFSALCYKMGVISYHITGDKEGSDYGHAWNLTLIDGNWRYVDVTFLDSLDKIAPFRFKWELLNDLNQSFAETDWGSLSEDDETNERMRSYQYQALQDLSEERNVEETAFKNDAFGDVTSVYYGSFDVNNDLDYLMSTEVESNVAYYNSDIAGTKGKNEMLCLETLYTGIIPLEIAGVLYLLDTCTQKLVRFSERGSSRSLKKK